MQGLKKTAKCRLDGLLCHPYCSAPLVGGGSIKFLHKPMINQVAQVIPLVYSSTPESDRDLRGSILTFAQQYWKELSGVPGFETITSQAPKFALEVIAGKRLEVAKLAYAGKCKRCSSTDKWKADHVSCVCGWGESC
jgi:hypothetical protein